MRQANWEQNDNLLLWSYKLKKTADFCGKTYDISKTIANFAPGL